MNDKIVNRKQLADYLGISEQALSQMAVRGTGPKYVKISGRLVRYRMVDVEAWLELNLVTSSKDNRSAEVSGTLVGDGPQFVTLPVGAQIRRSDGRLA